MQTTFLIISIIITLSSVIPYIRDILKGTTRPNLVSWITWTLLTGIAAAAQISAQEYVAAFFTGAAATATAMVVIFGLRHGFVRYGRFDIICQLSAVIGIILWQLFDSPAIGVLAAVTIDLIGALPTLRHSWNKPHEETWQTFGISSLAAIFAVGALASYTWVTLPYALYLIVINFILAIIILQRQKITPLPRTQSS
jgi:hypothetical protein